MTPIEFRAFRNATGLSVRKLAARLAVAPRTISRWEAGESRIPLAVGELLARLAAEKVPA